MTKHPLEKMASVGYQGTNRSMSGSLHGPEERQGIYLMALELLHGISSKQN